MVIQLNLNLDYLVTKLSNQLLFLSQFPKLFPILSLILQSKEVDGEWIIDSQVRDKSVNDTVKYNCEEE